MRKVNEHWQGSLKNGVKKNSNCPQARKKIFFENWFALIPIMFSTRRKIADKKNCFHQTENLFLLAGKRICSKIQRNCFHFKKYLKKLTKIGVLQQEYGSSLKIDFLPIPIIVSASRKNIRIEKYCFQQIKKTRFYWSI